MEPGQMLELLSSQLALSDPKEGGKREDRRRDGLKQDAGLVE